MSDHKRIEGRKWAESCSLMCLWDHNCNPIQLDQSNGGDDAHLIWWPESFRWSSHEFVVHKLEKILSLNNTLKRGRERDASSRETRLMSIFMPHWTCSPIIRLWIWQWSVGHRSNRIGSNGWWIMYFTQNYNAAGGLESSKDSKDGREERMLWILMSSPRQKSFAASVFGWLFRL